MLPFALPKANCTPDTGRRICLPVPASHTRCIQPSGCVCSPSSRRKSALESSTQSKCQRQVQPQSIDLEPCIERKRFCPSFLSTILNLNAPPVLRPAPFFPHTSNSTPLTSFDQEISMSPNRLGFFPDVCRQMTCTGRLIGQNMEREAGGQGCHSELWTGEGGVGNNYDLCPR